MLTDILTIIRKEFKEIFLMRGSLRGGIGNMLILVAIIGVLMPMMQGQKWLSSPVGALLWSWMPIFSAMGIVTDFDRRGARAPYPGNAFGQPSF